LISSILLIVTASAVLIALQEALNDIWGITEKPDSMIRNFLVDRSVSLIALFILGLLFIANTLLEILFGLGIGLIANYLPFSNTILNSVNFTLGILLIFLIFLFIFKFLPDVKISWWDGIVGAVVTTLLFLLGKNIIGWYLSSKNLSSAYGAASSVVLFLLWVYYSTLILFFGAEVTQVYSDRFGSGISPSENAEFKDSKLQSQSKLRRLVNLINPWHEE
jgi:membrane protein